jgi:hypothetical protein
VPGLLDGDCLRVGPGLDGLKESRAIIDAFAPVLLKRGANLLYSGLDRSGCVRTRSTRRGGCMTRRSRGGADHSCRAHSRGRGGRPCRWVDDDDLDEDDDDDAVVEDGDGLGPSAGHPRIGQRLSMLPGSRETHPLRKHNNGARSNLTDGCCDMSPGRWGRCDQAEGGSGSGMPWSRRGGRA